MASITVYTLDDDGMLTCTRSGDVESVLLAVDIEQVDFTLKPPPDSENTWRWVDNDWQITT